MTDQISRVSQYLAYSKEIAELESRIPAEEKIVREHYATEYRKLKGALRDFISKVNPTVEILCNLHRSTVRFIRGRIYWQNTVPEQKINGLTACDHAVRMGNEALSYLNAIIQKENTDANLYALALRYNTIAVMYENADALQTQAVSMAMEEFRNKINALISKRRALFDSPEALTAMADRVRENSRELSRQISIKHKVLEKSFVTEMSIPLGYDACDGSLLGEPEGEKLLLSVLNWDLQENGIAVIKADNCDIDGASLSDCVTQTVVHFLFSYPDLCKRLLLCDSCSGNAITTFAGVLKKENSELFFDRVGDSYVKNTDEEIQIAIGELNQVINQRIMVLGQSGCRNVLEYNKRNPDNPFPIILSVLNGYPFKYENAGDLLTSALKNGRDAGVYFLIIENTHEDEESKYCRKRMPNLEALTDHVSTFRMVEGTGILEKNGKRYSVASYGKSDALRDILSVFKDAAKDNEKSTVYLDSVLEHEDFASSPRRKDYSKILSIPVGKQGSNPVSVNFDVDSTKAHLALIGTTGSGKSAFINSLILSACKLYSPEELEVHLIIMAKRDFEVFGEHNLPHLKTLVTGDKILVANDVLDLIDEEMKRRSYLIGSHLNIYAYNEVAEKPLPRCLIVIDEFYQLVQNSDDAIKRITTIAQAGRAYGISLVISAIQFPIEVNLLIPLFGNRIEFKSDENAGQLIPQVANRQRELEGAKGRCFLACDGELHSVRVAYSEEGEPLRMHIEDVKNRYPGHTMALQSEIRALRVAKEQDVPFAARHAKHLYEEEGIIRVRLGRTYLSNSALEYAFTPQNNLLFLYGHYLMTKAMEASLIKDVLVLSRKIVDPTVYYIDYNKNASLKRASNLIRRLSENWSLISGKMQYCGSAEAEQVFEDLKDLMYRRASDETVPVYPILVVVAKADELFEDDDMREMLCELVSQGKENGVYFAIQCDAPIYFYGSDKYVKDAIIFPDRHREDDAFYSSAALCEALEKMPAGSTTKGRKLITNASTTAMDPRLHILCDNNKISVFIPYEYDEEYLKNVAEQE